jgi:membrane-associated phospholipid phosphatase
MWAIDPPFNTFPSLHVSLATLATLVVWQHNPRLGRWMALGATVLTLSTFLVKQHFIIDAAGGVAVAVLWYHYHYLPRARLK